MVQYIVYQQMDSRKMDMNFIGWATSANGEVVYQNQQEISNLSTINGTEINLYAKWKLILVYPSGVALDKSSAIIDLSTNNKTVKLNATILPSNANTNLNLVWSTNTPNVAVVDQNGLVTGIGNGFATITVTTQNGYTAQCSIVVQTSITNISLNKTSASIKMKVNETSRIQLNANVNPRSHTERVQWISNNENVLKVDQNGLVTAIRPGYATITASNSNHTIYSNCYISVNWDTIVAKFNKKTNSKKGTIGTWNYTIPYGVKKIVVDWKGGVSNAVADRKINWYYSGNASDSWQSDQW